MNKKFVSVTAFALLALLLMVAPVSADAIVTREEVEVSIDEIFSANCPDSDIEDIHVQGTYTIKTTSVLDGNGKYHFNSHWNWKGFTGTGITSGEAYIVTQIFSNSYHESMEESGLYNNTLIFNFHLVGKGSGDNIQVKGVNHVTVNANGEQTIDKATFRIVCK